MYLKMIRRNARVSCALDLVIYCFATLHAQVTVCNNVSVLELILPVLHAQVTVCNNVSVLELILPVLHAQVTVYNNVSVLELILPVLQRLYPPMIVNVKLSFIQTCKSCGTVRLGKRNGIYYTSHKNNCRAK